MTHDPKHDMTQDITHEELVALINDLADRPEENSATLDRILAIPQNHRQVRWVRWTRWFSDSDLGFSFILPRLAGMAGAAIIGFYVGTTDMVTLPDDNDSDGTLYTLTGLVFDTLPEESTL